MTGKLPAKITLRVITYTAEPLLIIEHDGKDVCSHDFATDIDGDVIMKAAELALAALGYTADHWRMYQDMSLMVLNLYYGAEPVMHAFGGSEVQGVKDVSEGGPV